MLVSAVILGTLVLATRTPERRTACVGTLIPAYVPPQAFSDLEGPHTLIVNPASGPGERPNASWRWAIERAQAGGSRVLGYVPTTYARRDPAAVEADAERYRAWYGVDGIFLDEVTHDEADLPYYRRLRLDAPVLVLNPGMVPARGYFDLADLVVTYEGPYADYARRLAREPEWVRDEPTAHLVYAASREQADELFAAPARSTSLYVTSGVQPNPWGAPPPYLQDERSTQCP